jgi:hypothetical protein
LHETFFVANLAYMNRLASTLYVPLRRLWCVCGLLVLLSVPRLFAQPSADAIAGFNIYSSQLESRLAQQHRTPSGFIVLPADPAARARLHAGDLLIEDLTPPRNTQPTDALVHDWRATGFVPNATPADFERLLRDFSAYPHNFAPQILSSTILAQTPTSTLLRLRTRQHHVLTVVLDTTCDVSFSALDSAHRYSTSRSTRIDEIAPTGDHGILYRLNTYWSYEQRDGGLYLQLESLSLTRSIPHGLVWAVQPYLESIPRDSLVFTLTSARKALTHNH